MLLRDVVAEADARVAVQPVVRLLVDAPRAVGVVGDVRVAGVRVGDEIVFVAYVFLVEGNALSGQAGLLDFGLRGLPGDMASVLAGFALADGLLEGSRGRVGGNGGRGQVGRGRGEVDEGVVEDREGGGEGGGG